MQTNDRIEKYGLAELTAATRHGCVQLAEMVDMLARGIPIPAGNAAVLALEGERGIGQSALNFPPTEGDAMLAQYMRALRERAPEVHKLLFALCTSLCTLESADRYPIHE